MDVLTRMEIERMARTARRQREVETMHTHNMNLRARLREICQALEKGEVITARRLAQSAMVYLDRGTVPADAIFTDFDRRS
jgi:hypothetical protein